MNYLFFDIECSNGLNICSLGYVKTNENFIKIAKKDILINPETRFKLGSSKQPRLVLSYSKEEFYKHENFAKHYNQIKRLLCPNNNFLIGFSIANDFNFINLACDRYNLPQLKLFGLDIQLLHKILSQSNTVNSLEKVMEYYNIQTRNLKLHKSCDDAHLTMLIFKQICKKHKLTLKDILQNYKSCIVTSKKYVKKNSARTLNKTHNNNLNTKLNTTNTQTNNNYINKQNITNF